jgi:hypothetical protein
MSIRLDFSQDQFVRSEAVDVAAAAADLYYLKIPLFMARQ